jgi:MazG family protein
VLRNWEALKAVERLNNGQDKGLLDGVPSSLPALAQAAEIQGLVARVGFDWPSAAGAREKVLEELAELDRAEVERRADELGDLLFAVVNYARRLDVDPEAALRTAISRFRRRFAAMESASDARGKPLADMSLEEMDRLWEQAKQTGL